ncbi:MAG: hypothetical protein AMK73_05350 [Planctomycetes bacterium SM23_32]|nr:MAG: hypothetical protein AMK73_05350 [Planctomycetes bacterium SM23_32]
MSDQRATHGVWSWLLKGIVVLACICLGSGAGVGLLYWHMKDEIRAKAQGVFDDALEAVLGEADRYGVVGNYPEGAAPQDKVYVNAAARPVLYAATGAAQGYQSQIKVLVSVEAPAPDVPVESDAAIHAMAVVQSQETPGLGERIKEVEKDVSIWALLAGKKPTAGRPWFQQQFSGVRLWQLGAGAQEPAEGSEAAETRATAPAREVAAITGATVTSTATKRAVRNAAEKIIAKTAEAYGG